MNETIENAPILSRPPHQLPIELTHSGDIPSDLDPLAEGILMEHQVQWLEDKSDLKMGVKGRRTGITFAEALDDTLIAATKRSDGGDNIFYIGDTKDKGREFIGYIAHFARIVAKELVTIEDFLFEDERDDGTSKFISAYRIRFSSEHRVEALSSRPENIRGLQGIVVIDEAAFHQDVRGVLDAVNALLIWGGKIRVISTHNGVLSPFNELLREALSGKIPFSVHHIPFQLAIQNGLYKRVCHIKGKAWSHGDEVEWEGNIRAAFGSRTAAMRQELDCIPAEQEGAALSRVQIEACMEANIPFERWICHDDFKNTSDEIRQTKALEFCTQKLLPHLENLNSRRQHVFGEDFARKGDATHIMVFEIGVDLVRRAVLSVELRNVPFDQQRDILFFVVDHLPRLLGGALDATGNGAYVAEKVAQRYGASIVEVHLTRQWYEMEMPAFIEAFSDKTILLPKHADILQDLQALSYVNGIIKIPDGHRLKGSDGLERHGDSAIAAALGYYASRAELEEFGYMSAKNQNDERISIFDTAHNDLLPKLRGGLY